MEGKLPKRLFRPGTEPEVNKINNSGKISLFEKIKDVAPSEYKLVSTESCFADVMKLVENNLGYSARLVQSMMCRQLITNKRHELWCVFGGKPLRFSLQEFHAITGLKCNGDYHTNDLDNWKDDKGFWSNVLKMKKKISIQDLKNKHLEAAKRWSTEDKIRLVYLCVISGLVMAKDEKTNISLSHIKLVMDVDKLRNYPWGRESFSLLVESIIKTRDHLANPNYVLDGFSYAFQIWAMEAVPVIVELLGKKIDEDLFQGPRCCYWKGLCRVTYLQIRHLENTFKKNEIVHPYISSTASNVDLCHSEEYMWPNDLHDDDNEVDALKSHIGAGYDFLQHVWEVKQYVEQVETNEENVVVGNGNDIDVETEDASGVANDISGTETRNMKKDGSSKSRKRNKERADVGAENRKNEMLYNRVGGSQGCFDDQMKSFMRGLFDDSFSTLQVALEKQLHQRFGVIEADLAHIKNYLLSTHELMKNSEKGTTFEPKATTSKRKATTSELPSKAHTKKKATKRDEFPTSDVLLSQSSMVDLNLNTQEFIRNHLGHLSQDTFVDGFDLTQTQPDDTKELEQKKIVLHTETDTLRLDKVRNPGKFDEDASLVFVDEDSWKPMQEWSMTTPWEVLQLGPISLKMETLTRIMSRIDWLHNTDIDAVMYLLRVNTSLGRLKGDRVAFMNCTFSHQMQLTYLNKFSKDRREHKWSDVLLAYGRGELPSHGKTSKIWLRDVDRLYTPVHVDNNHWIGMCINFVGRTIEVMNCFAHKKDSMKYAEPFRTMIPYLVKAVQAPSDGKQLNVTPYKVISVPVTQGLNKSCCHCGVYAVKFIECHLRGLPMSMMDDDNINGARIKIANDLWKAARDPAFIEIMSQYVPSTLDSEMETINIV